MPIILHSLWMETEGGQKKISYQSQQDIQRELTNIEKIKFGLKNKIKYMTFYCMSKDNLKRSSEDLNDFFLLEGSSMSLIWKKFQKIKF